MEGDPATVSGSDSNLLVTPLGVATDGKGVVYVSDTVGVKAFRVLLPPAPSDAIAQVWGRNSVQPAIQGPPSRTR